VSAHQSTQWFWSDWAGDQDVRRLTPAERGLWIDLLSFASVGKPTGYVCDQRGNPISYEEIARFTNATPTEVESLIVGILDKGVASRDQTGRLFNRRMVRAVQTAAKRKLAGKIGGDHTRLKWLELQSLPQHLPDHLLQHRVSDPIPSKNITTTTFVAAREKGLGNVSNLSRAELEATFPKRKTGW
jgi:hypothetical protein